MLLKSDTFVYSGIEFWKEWTTPRLPLLWRGQREGAHQILYQRRYLLYYISIY
jgi:hypothetical protein